MGGGWVGGWVGDGQVGAWLAKLQPIIDSSILLRMIGRAVTAKPKRGSGGPNKREASGGSDRWAGRQAGGGEKERTD